MSVLITTDGRCVFVSLHVVNGRGEYQVHEMADYRTLSSNRWSCNNVC